MQVCVTRLRVRHVVVVWTDCEVSSGLSTVACMVRVECRCVKALFSCQCDHWLCLSFVFSNSIHYGTPLCHDPTKEKFWNSVMGVSLLSAIGGLRLTCCCKCSLRHRRCCCCCCCWNKPTPSPAQRPSGSHG